MYWIHTNRILAIALLLALAPPVRAGPAEDQYAVAAGHYVRQRWQLVAQEFEVFLERFPQHERADTAVFFLGESLVQLGRHDEARARFATFLEKAPQHRYASQALFRKGETAYLTGRHEQAERDLEQFRQKHPDHALNAYALVYLGEIRLAAADAAGAEAAFAEALRRFPDGPLADESRFGMGRAREVQGDWRAAERFYRFLADSQTSSLADEAQLQLGVMQHRRAHHEQAAQTLTAFENRFQDSPLLVDAKYWLGMTRFSLKQYEAAVQTFTQAGVVAQDHPLAAAIEFWTAEALRRCGDLKTAKVHYERVWTTWPDAPWADDSLQAVIQLAFDAGEYEQVQSLVKQFDERFRSSPLRVLAQQAKGRSLLKQERYAEAMDIFEALVKAEQDDSQSTQAARRAARYYLALACLGRQQHEKALAVLSEIKLDGEDIDLQQGVRTALASAWMGLKKYDRAVAPLQAYLAAQPKGPDASKCRAQLVVSLAELGRLDEARQTYDQLMETRPDPSLAMSTTLCLAEAAYAAKKHKLAGDLFTVLARQDNPPDYVAKGLSGLAWTQYAADRAAQSAATFQRVLQEHPGSPLAPEAAWMRGQALEKLHQLDAALAAYHLILEKYANSKQAPAAQLRAAQLHDQLGQDREAAELFEQLASQRPEPPNLDAVLYQWAWVLVDLERPDEADAIFNRLWRDCRSSEYWADAAYRLAERAARAEDHERAIRLADEIIASHCDRAILAHALYLKGQSAAAMGRWEEVDAPMSRIMNEFSDSELLLPAEYWAAEALYRRGRYEEAGRRFDNLSKKTQGRDDAWLGMIPLRQAQVLAHKKQWQESFELAQTIERRFPKFRQQYEADYLLGRCHSSQGRFDDARAAYERVIRSPAGGQTETAAMAQWMIGESYLHQKSYDEAIRAYHRVEGLFAYPHWQAAALLQAGKCHEMKSNWNEAVKLYAQILKEYPKTTFTEEAGRRMRVAQQRATKPAAPPENDSRPASQRTHS